jgi:uncharacterized membrane protein
MTDQITESIVVRANVSDVYAIWMNFENFPRFMQHIKEVTKTGERMSHWVMEGPLGTRIEWEAETTRLEENQRIAWNSKDNSAIKTSGQVIFRPLSENETEVTVTLHYVPPVGLAGEVMTELFGNPEGRLHDDLQRFKAHIENTSTRIHTPVSKRS